LYFLANSCVTVRFVFWMLFTQTEIFPARMPEIREVEVAGWRVGVFQFVGILFSVFPFCISKYSITYIPDSFYAIPISKCYPIHSFPKILPLTSLRLKRIGALVGHGVDGACPEEIQIEFRGFFS
jgi:hypothetical protein